MNLCMGWVKLTYNNFGKKTSMTYFFPKGYCYPLENRTLKTIHAL